MRCTVPLPTPCSRAPMPLPARHALARRPAPMCAPQLTLPDRRPCPGWPRAHVQAVANRLFGGVMLRLSSLISLGYSPLCRRYPRSNPRTGQRAGNGAPISARRVLALRTCTYRWDLHKRHSKNPGKIHNWVPSIPGGGAIGWCAARRRGRAPLQSNLSGGPKPIREPIRKGYRYL